VLAAIDLAVMASSDDAASVRVDSTVKEECTSEDPLAAFIQANPQLILLKYFVDLAKNNPPTKESEGPPPKESGDPVPLSSPTIIPDDTCSSTVGDIPTCSDSTITGFTDYISE
jgi:hypothetical protein